MNHLEPVRNLQEETGGLYGFIPGHSSARTRPLGRFVKEEATAVEYLKTLAISRLYLDNFLNVQSSWVTQGLRRARLGLRFGGNDVGSIMIEENVVSAGGRPTTAHEEELRRIIRDAGFVPKQRDTLYRDVLPELGGRTGCLRFGYTRIPQLADAADPCDTDRARAIWAA